MKKRRKPTPPVSNNLPPRPITSGYRPTDFREPKSNVSDNLPAKRITADVGTPKSK